MHLRSGMREGASQPAAFGSNTIDMVDAARTVPAELLVHYLHFPRALVSGAWLRLAAESDDIEEKGRCLNAVLELDPDNEPASLAVLLLDQKRPES